MIVFGPINSSSIMPCTWRPVLGHWNTKGRCMFLLRLNGLIPPRTKDLSPATGCARGRCGAQGTDAAARRLGRTKRICIRRFVNLLAGSRFHRSSTGKPAIPVATSRELIACPILQASCPWMKCAQHCTILPIVRRLGIAAGVADEEDPGRSHQRSPKSVARRHLVKRNGSGSFAILAAMRRASAWVMSLAAIRRPDSSS